MCGIVGFTGPKDFVQLKKLLEIIEHRGRDERVIDYQSSLNLGMNRLAIKDLQTDLYPLHYKNYLLIYNGEIYNYQALQKKLQTKGIEFKTNCDGEVILPLFDRLGPKAFAQLEGMFTLAILDLKSQQLFLARDKAGQKPLYYLPNQEGFAFSSEMKALMPLLKTPNLETNLLPKFFREGSLLGEKTLIKEVKKIRPGQYLKLDLESLQLTTAQYWSLSTSLKKTTLSEKKLTDRLDNLLRDAVKKRLMSDVPIGTFLSGGVDSSLITYYASQETTNLKTYSVSFPGHEKDDESYYSHLVSEKLKTNHTEIVCTAQKAKAVIKQLGKIVDTPIIDPAVIPTYLLAQEASKEIRVALSGEGADELFAGYYRYPKQLTGLWLQKYVPLPLWSLIKNFVPGRIRYKVDQTLTPLSSYYSSQDVWTPTELEKLLPQLPYQAEYNYPPASMFDQEPLLAMQLRDFQHYLGEQLLMKIDKCTMAHNLEARSPFLDSQVTQFAWSLPKKYKIQGLNNKYLLRKVAARYLPQNIAWRFKKGFTVPLNDWYRHELRDVVENTVEELGHYPKIFNHLYLKQIVQEHLRDQKDHRDKIWSLIVINQWLKTNNL